MTDITYTSSWSIAGDRVAPEVLRVERRGITDCGRSLASRLGKHQHVIFIKGRTKNPTGSAV